MAKRSAPKGSAPRVMPVDEWLKATAGGWRAVAALRLIAITRKIAPNASISIKWGHPVIDESGPVAYISVASTHVTLGFWRGAELADPRGVLEGGERMKQVKITSPDSPDEKVIAALLRQALALNRKLGDFRRR